MPLCEGCGSSYEDRFQFCPYCGRAKPQQQQIKIALEDNSGLACPFCRQSDRVEKITAIVKHQTQISESSVPVTRTYSNSDGKVRTSTTYEKVVSTTTSSLASILTPPQRPAIPPKPSVTLVVALGLFDALLFILGIFGFFSGLYLRIFKGASWRPGASVQIIFVAILLLGLVYMLWASYKKASEKYPALLQQAQDKVAQWEAAMKKWRESYYCYRDERVFVPGLGTSAPVDRLHEYVYVEDHVG